MIVGEESVGAVVLVVAVAIGLLVIRRDRNVVTPKASIKSGPDPIPELSTSSVVHAVAETGDRDSDHVPLQPLYLEAVTLVERLHRRLLDVIRDQLDRHGLPDVSSVQALLLYNIGDKELTAGELSSRGYYLAADVSRRLQKLVDLGLLDHQRSRVDRRSVRIRLTEQGQVVRKIVDELYQKHGKTVAQVGGISSQDLVNLNKSLHRLERFWTDQILYRL